MPLQFNTEGPRQADSRDGSSNLRETLEHAHKDNSACAPCEFPTLVYGGGIKITPGDQERRHLFFVGFDPCNLFLDKIAKYVLSCIFLILFRCRRKQWVSPTKSISLAIADLSRFTLWSPYELSRVACPAPSSKNTPRFTATLHTPLVRYLYKLTAIIQLYSSIPGQPDALC